MSILSVCHATYLTKRTAKVRTFFELPNFSQKIFEKFLIQTFQNIAFVVDVYLSKADAKVGTFFISANFLQRIFWSFFEVKLYIADYLHITRSWQNAI